MKDIDGYPDYMMESIKLVEEKRAKNLSIDVPALPPCMFEGGIGDPFPFLSRQHVVHVIK